MSTWVAPTYAGFRSGKSDFRRPCSCLRAGIMYLVLVMVQAVTDDSGSMTRRDDIWASISVTEIVNVVGCGKA